MLSFSWQWQRTGLGWPNIYDCWKPCTKQPGQIRSLEEELARKHPYDEQAEAAVRKAISKLDDAEVRFLGWLLQVDRPGRVLVQGQGYGGAPESILQKTSTLLIGFKSVRPGNGLVEMDRIYYVNPKSQQAIKNALYSLPRTTHSQGH